MRHKGVNYVITKDHPCYVDSNNIDQDAGVFHSLRTAIDLSLSRSDKLLIMIGEYAVSAYKKNMHYYFFDSHSRSNSGEIAQENGTSVLLEFDSSASLMHYLKHDTFTM